MILLPGLNVWTTHVPMRNYREIHCRFVYKAKEGRHIRNKLTITNNTTSQQNNGHQHLGLWCKTLLIQWRSVLMVEKKSFTSQVYLKRIKEDFIIFIIIYKFQYLCFGNWMPVFLLHLYNTVVSNRVNSDHVLSFSCLVV